jgi:hypothetical protein
MSTTAKSTTDSPTQRHELVWEGDVKVDARGRRLKICAACGKIAVGQTHTPLPKAKRESDNQKLGREKAREAINYLHTPWEVRLLAIALDRAIAAGPDVLGWRLAMRAADCRRTIDLPPELEPEMMVVPQESIAQQEVDNYQYRRPRSYTEVTQSALSRARQTTKGIKHDSMRELATRAVSLGAQLRKGRGGHIILSGGPLNAQLVFSGTSDGSARAWENLRAEAKRRGLDVSGL